MKLNDELIIAFLEGNLSEDEEKNVQALINENDENFLRYSQLYDSYYEMMDAELEEVPDELIEKAYKKLGIAQSWFSLSELKNRFNFGKKGYVDESRVEIRPAFKSLQEPADAYSPLSISPGRSILGIPLSSATIGLSLIGGLFVTVILINLSKSPASLGPGQILSPPTEWLMRSDDSSGVSIQMKNDNIIITQKEMIERQIMITGVTGTPIYLDKEFNDTLNIIKWPEVSGDIFISIYQNDELLFNKKIEIINDQ